MPRPRHEVELERNAISSLLEALRHPTQIPSFIRTVWADTRAYYAAADVLDLERAELIQIVSYTRKMALKLTGSALFLGLLVILAVVGTCKADDVFGYTPYDLNGTMFKLAPKEHWNGLYINLTETLLPADSELRQLGRPSVLSGHNVLLIPFGVGLAWQALRVAVAAGSIATAIQGCTTSDGSAGAIAGCVFGIAGTVLSIGSAFQAAKKAGWFARARNTWDGSGLEQIDLSVFSKRSQNIHQEMHEYLTRAVLSQTFGDEPEFMGYVADGHRLSGRDEDHKHPRAPIYRINHPKHGYIDIATRQHTNATRITASFANHGLEKRQSFQHERLSDHLFEGRFDESAHEADPDNPQFDAAGGFQQIEDAVKCFAGGDWQAGQVLSAQFYDDNSHSTFGFASVGVFENHDADGPLQDFAPQGMPLARPSC
ncbi:hypothetical protein GGS20DRAFT_241238 [Poronia punctata]|nr:hypothetical protein GGS20DRAFT_241238 [Poronia punctata]